MRYVGRFAPSPTGPLHAGSLVAALASWLDARAHGGRWLVRIEDVDQPRTVADADRTILGQLADCGLVPDEPPVWQSTRDTHYAEALQRLTASGWAYPCGCTRRDLELLAARRGLSPLRGEELVYPGTCRRGLRGKPARAARVLAAASVDAAERPLVVDWTDRRLGPQSQDVSRAVGDFVVRRADGWWAYQLAVVVDDALQDVTHVVRGEDLADNTARQIHLQRVLGWSRPAYLHVPVVRGSDGEKLSKQNGAIAVDTKRPLVALRSAGAHLGLHHEAGDAPAWLEGAVERWGERWRTQVAPAVGRAERTPDRPPPPACSPSP
ncbi:MAG TPA: tRNA glutamyl-Q(34) synthetase GluQRS [Caldimonas sp.]|nr:tRNA glutamyl-Q(34) synthetase GluQRS [Caldimonas sp.]